MKRTPTPWDVKAVIIGCIFILLLIATQARANDAAKVLPPILDYILQETNLIQNGNFENGLDPAPWVAVGSTAGSFLVRSTGAGNGEYVGTLVNFGNDESLTQTINLSECVKNPDVRFTVHGANISPGWRLSIDGELITEQTFDGINDPTPVRFKPAVEACESIEIQFFTTEISSSFFFDDVRILVH